MTCVTRRDMKMTFLFFGWDVILSWSSYCSLMKSVLLNSLQSLCLLTAFRHPFALYMIFPFYTPSQLQPDSQMPSIEFLLVLCVSLRVFLQLFHFFFWFLFLYSLVPRHNFFSSFCHPSSTTFRSLIIHRLNGNMTLISLPFSFDLYG